MRSERNQKTSEVSRGFARFWFHWKASRLSHCFLWKNGSLGSEKQARRSSLLGREGFPQKSEKSPFLEAEKTKISETKKHTSLTKKYQFVCLELIENEQKIVKKLTIEGFWGKSRKKLKKWQDLILFSEFWKLTNRLFYIII